MAITMLSVNMVSSKVYLTKLSVCVYTTFSYKFTLQYVLEKAPDHFMPCVHVLVETMRQSLLQTFWIWQPYHIRSTVRWKINGVWWRLGAESGMSHRSQTIDKADRVGYILIIAYFLGNTLFFFYLLFISRQQMAFKRKRWWTGGVHGHLAILHSQDLVFKFGSFALSFSFLL